MKGAARDRKVMAMAQKPANFEVKAGKPTILSITDPDDGKTRNYLIGITVFSVSKVGNDPKGTPLYQVGSSTQVTLFKDPLATSGGN